MCLEPATKSANLTGRYPFELQLFMAEPMVRRPSVIGGIWHTVAYLIFKRIFLEIASTGVQADPMGMQHLPGWWYTYPSEKYDFVSWDYYSLYIYIIYEKNMFQTTNQSSPESVDENFPAIPSSSQYQSQLFHRRQVTSPLWTQRLVILCI